MNFPRLGFYRALIIGFASTWIIPEEYLCKIMLKWYELKQ
jgi:hypothetical protein